MKLDATICYQALKTRDARFDGRFFTAVSSTGIFCRPVCPATTPKESNCTFYPTASQALQAGYRPCLRCRPETAPESPVWLGTQTTVRRALRLIEEGGLDDGKKLEHLCEKLGVGERHLRRLFQDHLGTSPKQVALNRRLIFAKKLVHQSNSPMTGIAFACGFASLRRFNDAYVKAFKISPSKDRKSQNSTAQEAALTLTFAYRPPFDWEGLLRYFDGRSIAPVEEIDGDIYKRIVRYDDEIGTIIVKNNAAKNRLEATLQSIPTTYLRDVSIRIRRLFDLDCVPELIAENLGENPVVGELVKANPGRRLPGGWDGFEIAIRAVIGQQISVKGARTICQRVIDRNGTGLFPTPQEMFDLNLDGLGLTGRRITTLKSLAEHWEDITQPLSIDDQIQALCDQPGIGPWSAHYILMRSLGEPDLYPVDDLGLIRALEKLDHPASKKDLKQFFETVRPWRAYATMHLWSVL